MTTHSRQSNTYLIGIFLIIALVLTACPAAVPTGGEAATTDEMAAESETAAGEDGEEVLTILYWQAASIANTYLAAGTKDIDAAALVLEPLANFNENGELVPALAAEIPTLENGGVSEDLTSITWQLKEGVVWSDGTPLTAEDAVFSWEYCTNEETGCAWLTSFNSVANVEAVDETTIKITFDGAKPNPYEAFVSSISPIIQKAQFGECVGAAAQTCSDANLSPIGTGPYKVVDFRVNDVVTYEPNELYRDGRPFFDRVVFKGGGDAVGAARAVLETGEADYAWNLQVEPEILNEMVAGGLGTVVSAYGTSVERILINQTNPDSDLGDNRSVWMADGSNAHPFLVGTVIPQAMSMAINRNILAEQLYGAGGQATCNILPGPPRFASSNNDACLTQDIEGAKALLDEAGIVDSDGDSIREYEGIPLSITYQTSTNSVRQKTQALVKQWWAEIGIETELLNHDAGVFFGGDPNSPDTYGKFYTDVEMFTNGGTGTDPQTYMSNWLSGEISQPSNNFLGNNVPRWASEEYDAIFAELTQTAGEDARADLAIQLNDLLVQNFVMIPLVHRGSVSAHASTLQGVRMNAWDSEMWNIEDWSR